MKNNFYFLLIISVLLSCKKNHQIELQFLDEYIVKDSLVINNTLIGGLSGLDYAEGYYYCVVDDQKKPRFLKVKIDINHNEVTSINFESVSFLKDTTTSFFTENAMDLEAIFFDEATREINFVSEGSINSNKSPSVFSIDENGKLVHVYELPKSLKNNSSMKHNGVFEGASKSVNQKGFWVSLEAPLNVDGEAPTFKKASSPIRITYFDKNFKKATKQFAYHLEHIEKPSKGSINLNGVTAILEYKEGHFLVIERAYKSGYGPFGNTVKIFEATIDHKTTNVLAIDSLRVSEYIPLKKRLVFDFNDIKHQLTQGIIDNIEGITLGPKLASGNQSLLLVSDNNFQAFGEQLNQFILMEIPTK
jgi:hypothetical protein